MPIIKPTPHGSTNRLLRVFRGRTPAIFTYASLAGWFLSHWWTGR